MSPKTPVPDAPVQRVFITFPDGDLVLVSNDDVEFRVDSLILRRASPVFAEMFRPSQTHNAWSKRVPLAETGIILDDVLRFIYPPGILPTTSSSKHTCALYRALNKYQVTSNSFMTCLSRYIGTLEPPLQAWALAMELGDDEARKIAVRRFIEQSSDPLDDNVEQLTRVEGRGVLQLLCIRRDVVAHASKQISFFLPGLSACSTHKKSMIECLRQQSNMPSDQTLKTISFHCSTCTASFNMARNCERRDVLRAYIEEILERAVRAENDPTATVKVIFPDVPAQLLV